MSRPTLAVVALAVLLPLSTLTPASSTPAALRAGHEGRAVAPIKIVAKMGRTVASAGYQLEIRGRLTRRAAGQRLVLQRRLVERERWRKVATGQVGRDGEYSLVEGPSWGGHYLYRVVKPAADGLRRGVSNVVPVTVWSSTQLGNYNEGAMSGIGVGGVRVNTRVHHPSIVMLGADTPGYVEYTLGRKCDRLTADYALTDDSQTGATGTVGVVVDGAPVATHTFGVGAIVEDHVVNVTDAFRIRFELQASGGGKAAVVVPWVHCAP